MAPVSKYSKITRIRKTNPFKKNETSGVLVVQSGFHANFSGAEGGRRKDAKGFLVFSDNSRNPYLYSI